MISIETLLLFLATTFVVVLSPGPAAISVTGEAASNGFKRAFLVILGVAVANVAFFVLSGTGIAALIIASNALFTAIKWIGVAYLLYLGVGAIIGSAGPLNISPSTREAGNPHKAFLKGFIVEASNPKALLYFSALLPQFVDISRPVFPQLAIMCFMTFFIDLLCYSLYAYLGHKSSRVAISPFIIKCINRTAGGMLIFAGIKMSTVERG
ncbi:MAG: LysE family translocator [Rhodocyclaceae bacterium]|jgi:homoserine/homoserine lactone efflux protein|nr:LysE family translocator [Rhodocyclaceae bacterium]